MQLKYLITTQTKGRKTPREIYNKYAVYDGEHRLRASAGYSTREAYYESKAERETKAWLQDLLGEAILVRSMPDPADFRFVVFEALYAVSEEIEIPLSESFEPQEEEYETDFGMTQTLPGDGAVTLSRTFAPANPKRGQTAFSDSWEMF